MYWNKAEVQDIVSRALGEDLGSGGDITSQNLLSAKNRAVGVIRAREEGIIAGLEVMKLVFKQCDPAINFEFLLAEGARIKDNDEVAVIKGSSRSILKGERTALNFLQRLSGIATKTRTYVDQVGDYPVRITDTRKTTPTLRLLEKYAVTVGGGYNHRLGLYDAVMLKDNHLTAAGGIKKAVTTIKANIPHTTKIEIEVEDMAGVKDALKAGVDIIMLDNMSFARMKEAVDYIEGRVVVEASGGITLENVVQVAKTGVDVISVGALTHQIASLDLSLDLKVNFDEEDSLRI